MRERVGAGSGAAASEPRNEVVLSGRVSKAAEEHRLPSGDVVMTTRIVIDREVGRPRASGSARSKQRVDAIDCVAWSARVQRVIRRWEIGDRVYLEGAIRRRFYRASTGVASRFEVEVSQARRLATAD